MSWLILFCKILLNYKPNNEQNNGVYKGIGTMLCVLPFGCPLYQQTSSYFLMTLNTNFWFTFYGMRSKFFWIIRRKTHFCIDCN